MPPVWHVHFGGASPGGLASHEMSPASIWQVPPDTPVIAVTVRPAGGSQLTELMYPIPLVL